MFTLPELKNDPYFMRRDVCVIHLISLCLVLFFSSSHYAGLQITFTSCTLWCHSAFSAFKSSRSTTASLFKTVTAYDGQYSLFMKLLFIDYCSLRCSSRAARAGD